MKKICITGGAGFIASHVTEHLCRNYPAAEIIVIDTMNYAARHEFLAPVIATGQVRLVEVSICERSVVRELLRNTDLLIHAAAESHVDNSYKDIRPFIESNIQGTICLLQAAVENDIGLFFHVSTDEVYGESSERDFSENDRMNPTNPYAASKASAEMFVHCFEKSYGLPTRITRANNIYGTRQYPEKLIPKLICDILRGEKFQVHGNGTAIRSFLHVSDFCEAVSAIIERGEDGGIYNVPALRDYSVMDVVRLVADAMQVPLREVIEYGPDRPFNDSRYGVTGDRLVALGWQPRRTLEEDLEEIIQWYGENLGLYYQEHAPAAALAFAHSDKLLPFSRRAPEREPVAPALTPGL